MANHLCGYHDLNSGYKIISIATIDLGMLKMGYVSVSGVLTMKTTLLLLQPLLNFKQIQPQIGKTDVEMIRFISANSDNKAVLSGG